MSNYFTKEGIEVKPGQVWEDLDKRMTGRKVQVTELVIVRRPGHGRGKFLHVPAARVRAWNRYQGAVGHETNILIRRMHKHSTGFKLVQDV